MDRAVAEFPSWKVWVSRVFVAVGAAATVALNLVVWPSTTRDLAGMVVADLVFAFSLGTIGLADVKVRLSATGIEARRTVGLRHGIALDDVRSVSLLTEDAARVRVDGGSMFHRVYGRSDMRGFEEWRSALLAWARHSKIPIMRIRRWPQPRDPELYGTLDSLPVSELRRLRRAVLENDVESQDMPEASVVARHLQVVLWRFGFVWFGAYSAPAILVGPSVLGARRGQLIFAVWLAGGLIQLAFWLLLLHRTKKAAGKRSQSNP